MWTSIDQYKGLDGLGLYMYIYLIVPRHICKENPASQILKNRTIIDFYFECFY